MENKINNKIWIKLLILAAVLCVCLLPFKIIYNNLYYADAFSFEEAETPLTIDRDETVTAEFISNHDYVQGLAFNFNYTDDETIDIDANVKITVYYQDLSNVVFDQEIPLANMKRGEYTGISLNSELHGCLGQKFIVSYTFSDVEPEYEITAVLTDELDTSIGAKYLVDSAVKGENVTLGTQFITNKNVSYRNTVFAIFLILGLTIDGILAFILFSKKPVNEYLHKIYIIAAIGFGLIYSLLIPVMAAPDEPTHLYKAYAVSNQLLGYDATTNGYVNMRSCDAQTTLASKDLDFEYYMYFYGLLSADTGDVKMTQTTLAPVDASSYLYIVPALGITLGRLLGLNTVLTFMLGRFFNCLLFAIIASFAIKKIPFGKMVIFIWTMLPIMLQQVDSYSYDCPINALSVLIIALTLNFLYGKDKLFKDNPQDEVKPFYKMPSFYIYIIAVLLLAPCKGGALLPIAALPIMLVAKIIMNSKAVYSLTNYIKEDKRNKIKVIIGCLLALCVFAVLCLLVLKKIASGPDMAKLSWADTDRYTLAHYLKNPKSLIFMLCYNIQINASNYLMEMFGGYLGWLDIQIKIAFILPFILLIIFAAMKKDGEEDIISIPSRIWLILMGIGSVFAAILAMLLYWTPVGYNFILGVQGRYFLPGLLMIMLCLRGGWCVRNKNSDKWIVGIMMIMQIMMVCLLV